MSEGVPAYLATMRETFPAMRDVEIELMLAADAGLQELTGHSEHHHRREAMKMLFPDRAWHCFRERAIESYWRAKRARMKELFWIGSSSSNKTGSMADLAIEIWLENPKATSVYVTSPYEDATETGVWAEIIERFDSSHALHDFLPGKVKESDNAIVMYDRNPRSFIKVITVDQIGKLVGRKSKNFDAGMMILICDELPEFKRGGEALISALKNLRSVSNFMLIGAGNFADVNDALGRLSEPVIDGGYESLDVDRDQEWQTKRRGLVIRFDGHQSPNVLAGEDRWPFVTTNEYLKDLEATEGGTRTPGYFRFGRSFPMLDFNEFTVTNATKVRAGGCYDDVEWNADEQHFGAHCDPGFGGDPCILQFWRYGRGYVDDRTLDVFELTEPPLVIPIALGLKDEDGKDETVDMQIAEKVKVELEKRKVNFRNFSFDDSLRGGIVQAFMRVLGVGVTAISSNGPPTKRKLTAIKQTIDASVPLAKRLVKTAKDEYFNFNTELHFAVSTAIDAGQIRGLNLSRAAVQQLITRRWRWSGKKKEIEPKDSREAGAKARGWGYKSHSGGKSPNESDALVGGLEMARRIGFQLAGLSTRSGGALELLREFQRETELRSLVNQLKGGTLPPGTLHSMESEHGRISPHLHS